ncbi:polymorphic toxin type 46 domain-containing protein [Thalassolituus sp.]|jgi:RHS repeat-associated protein|uniref:polymorphic toxin type 46 domain-containing protein n=1 Tax=Thalassolituus sp. TaxID=2030822 RepID=UPI0035160E28
MSGYEFEDDKGNRYRITKGAGPGYVHPENIGAGSTLVASDIFRDVPFESVAGAGNHFWFDVLSKIPDLPLPPKDALSTAVAGSYLTVEKLDTALAVDDDVADTRPILRIQIQQALTEIIAGERAEAAMHQRQMDKEGAVTKGLIYTGAFMQGIGSSAWGAVLWAKEVSDLVNPVVLINQQAKAIQEGWESDSFYDKYRDSVLTAQKRELVEVLGFDPTSITEQQIDEAIAMAQLVLDDPTLRDMLYRFVKDYAEAQHAIEVTEVAGSGAFELILTIILAAATGGVGVVAAVGSKTALIRKFRKVGDSLSDFAKVSRKLKLQGKKRKAKTGKADFKQLEQSPVAVNKTNTDGANSGKSSHADAEAAKSSPDAEGASHTEASKTCTNGCPISMVNGEELLELVDFEMAGPIPFTWKRVYRSSNLKQNNGLGYGWSSPLNRRLFVGQQDIQYFDDQGRSINFNPVNVGGSCRNRTEKLILTRTAEDEYQVANANGQGITYHFASGAARATYRMTRWTDNSGHQVNFEYQNNLVKRITTSEGEELQLTHDNKGHVVAVDRVFRPESRPQYVSRQVAYEFNEDSDLITSFDEMGHTQHFRYEQHLIQQRTLKSGFSYYFEWTHIGPDARCLRNWGDKINGEHVYDYKFEWDLDNRTSHATDSRGGRLSYKFNRLGLPVWIRQPEGDETRYEYDRSGNLIKLTDPAGNTELFQYNHNGHLISHTNKLGYTQNFRVNGTGQLIEAKDPTGATWQRKYDAQGRLISTADPAGRSLRMDYTPEGLLAGVTDADGNKTSYVWDNHRRITAVRNPLGSHTRYSYNERGQVTRVVYPNQQSQNFEYNDAGQCIAVTNSDGSQTNYQYTPHGQLAAVSDHTGRTTRYEYDWLSQVSRRVDASGQAFNYHYDAERNLVGLTNENGERYQLKYDGNERLIEEIGFDGRVQRYQYNIAGHLIQSEEYRDINSEILPVTRIAYRRDAEGKLLSQWQELGRGKEVNELIAEYGYDPVGRLLSANNPHRQLSWAYSPTGQVISAMQDKHELIHNYDSSGRRSATQLPGGDAIHYGFNPLGQTASVHWNDQLIASFTHDDAGREALRQLGNGLQQTQSFDPQGRLQQQTLMKAGATDGHQQPLNKRSYHYSAAGQISQIDDQLRGSTQYHYDQIDRLIQVSGPQPEQFVHDPAGNLLGSPDEVNGQNRSGQVTGNRLNFQGDRHYSYDDQGNRVEERRGKDGRQTTRYRYDHQNRLTGVAKTIGDTMRITEYQYDALGRRIRKVHKDESGNVTGGTEFYWNDDVLLSEQSADITAEQQGDSKVYVFEPGTFKPLAFVQRGEINHYHLDHLGTPQEITNANGELVWTAQYKAYGSLALAAVQQVENNLRFQGQYYDEESGLHYNRARYYDPDCGRFINQDPIGLLGGNNNYQYVPNPVTWVDPLGLSCKEVDASDSAALIKQRKKDAFSFYLSQGFDEADIPSHLTGIDFTKPVNVVPIPEGTTVYQFQSPGAPQGNYYTTNPNATPSQLGISPLGTNRALNEVQPKVKGRYTVTKDVEVLQSTAKPVEDFWSVSGQTYATEGGGVQMFSSNKSAFKLVGG